MNFKSYRKDLFGDPLQLKNKSQNQQTNTINLFFGSQKISNTSFSQKLYNSFQLQNNNDTYEKQRGMCDLEKDIVYNHFIKQNGQTNSMQGLDSNCFFNYIKYQNQMEQVDKEDIYIQDQTTRVSYWLQQQKFDTNVQYKIGQKIIDEKIQLELLKQQQIQCYVEENKQNESYDSEQQIKFQQISQSWNEKVQEFQVRNTTILIKKINKLYFQTQNKEILNRYQNFFKKGEQRVSQKSIQQQLVKVQKLKHQDQNNKFKIQDQIFKLKDIEKKCKLITQNEDCKKQLKYKILSKQQKELIVQLSKSYSNVVVAKMFNISINNISRWKKSCSRKHGAGRKIASQQLEKKVITYVKESILNKKCLTRKMIQNKARQLSRDKNFKGSKGWFQRFYGRNKSIFEMKG